MEIQVMSRMNAEKYSPSDEEICISIKSESEYALGYDRKANLSSNFMDILYLSFDDTADEMFGMESAKTLNRFQVKEIVDFVNKHKDKKKLTVHCFAGISRSRSMSAAISEYLKITHDLKINNRDVYNKVLVGLQESEIDATK